MAQVSLHSVSFHYSSPYHEVFQDLSLTFFTEWKTGLVGRNGKGKSTLLGLLAGVFVPQAGQISGIPQLSMFPGPAVDGSLPVFRIIKDAVAPFTQWECEIERLLALQTRDALERYSHLLQHYTDEGGYEIDALILRECSKLGLSEELLNRPFHTLSGGEQTRALIVPLFLRRGSYPVIDEPTDHLDRQGREILASYLSQLKRGFLLVSHDRALLDGCTDHTLALLNTGAECIAGPFSVWRSGYARRMESENAADARLHKEISKLEKAAQARRSWSNAREKEKTAAADSGYVSHKAAKMMKRALAIERRVDAAIEEKKQLLRDREHTGTLRIPAAGRAPDIIVRVDGLRIERGGREIFHDFDLTVYRGERVSIAGANGSGKTSLLAAIEGALRPAGGSIARPSHIRTLVSYQSPRWQRGLLREHLRRESIDETRFRQILGRFSVWGEIFEKPLETFSKGELRKVDLVRSFMEPAALLIWDEPLNHLDIDTREQIEKVILEDEPTMLFVEHDAVFCSHVATKEVRLG